MKSLNIGSETRKNSKLSLRKFRATLLPQGSLSIEGPIEELEIFPKPYRGLQRSPKSLKRLKTLEIFLSMSLMGGGNKGRWEKWS